MAGGTNIGSAYITIVPTFKGGIRAISEQINGVDGSKAGEKVGQELAAGAARGVGRSMSAVSAAILRSAAQAGNGIASSLSSGGEKGATEIQQRIAGMFEHANKSAEDSASVFNSAGFRISSAFSTVGQRIGGSIGAAVQKSGITLGNIANVVSGVGIEGGHRLAAGILGGVSEIDSQLSAKLAPVGKAAGAALAAGVTAGIAMAAKSGIAASDTLKGFDKTMSFAGYDGSAIAQAKSDLQGYADASVYDLHDVMNTAAQLGANGVTDFSRVTQALGNLNAASGGTSQTFGLAAQQLVQMNAAGKVSYADWKVFAQDMPGASKIIQDELASMGAYEGDFNEALSNGEVSADEFNDALLNLGFTDVAASAASSTDTVSAAVGQVQASVEKAGQTVFDALVSSGDIQQITSDVTGWIDGAAQAIVSHMDEIKSGIRTAIAVIRTVGPPALIAAGALKGIALAVKAGQTVSAFARGLRTIGSSIASIAGKGAKAAASLAETAAGEAAAGAASSASASQILAAAVAVVALGAGVALASAGMWVLADAAVKLASGGGAAVGVMVGMVAAVALLAAGAALLGPALTAGAVGMIAFGAAVVLVGAGFLLVSAGVTLLSGALPTIASFGLQAAASIAAMAGALLLLTPAMLVAAPMLLVFAAGALACGAGLAVFGGGAAVAGAGLTVLAAGVAALVDALWGLLSVGEAVAADVSSAFSSMGSALSGVFSGIESVMESPFEAARDFIGGIPGQIEGFFSGMHIELPQIKLPHFSLSGSFNPLKGEVPSISVDWYAQGAVFAAGSPQVIGIGDNPRYREAALPLSPEVLSGIGKGVADNMDRGGGSEQVIAWLDANLGAIIERYAPTATPREFGRMVRASV